MKRNSQKSRVLARLKQGTWLSTVEATSDMHILRLGAVIFDLKKEGHQIEERTVQGASYGEYRLLSSPPPEREIVIENGKPVMIIRNKNGQTNRM